MQVRLLSPTRRRIHTTEAASLTDQQLRTLGWTRYYGTATVTTGHDGACASGGVLNPDPRDGWIEAGSDPKIVPDVPHGRPPGSLDTNPYALEL